MEIEYIIKRDYSTKAFHLEKISGAIHKAMNAVGHGDEQNAQDVALSVYQTLVGRKENDVEYVPTIEEVQDIVETKLMESKFTEAAKAYILYRNKRAQQRESDLFEKRVNLKPYEYPHLYEYVPAIRHSYWIHSEFNFTSDIQDFKSRLSDVERSAIKNTMLAISQIEVAVKSFWGDLYHRIPKPEVGSVGSTFAESEVRHADAYSHLLEILGLNVEFKELKKKPAIMKRVHYLEKALKMALVHDIPELHLSDVTHDVKRNFPKLAEEVMKAEYVVMKEKYPNWYDDFSTFEDQNSVEALIVKYADNLSCVQYANAEINLGNKGYMKEVLHNAGIRCKKFESALKKHRRK